MTRSAKILTTGGFLAFFAFGFVDNLKGPLLPELLRSGEFNYSQGGTILLAGYIGFIVATLVTGVLADVVSNRGVLLLAGCCLCIGCIGFGATGSYPFLILFMAVIGIGLGAIELGANGLMVELHSQNRGRYLNLLSTCHGLGSLIVPLYAAWLLSLDVSWQAIYGSCVVVAIPLIMIFLPGRGIKTSVLQTEGDANELTILHNTSDKVAGWNWRSVRGNAFTRQMCAYYVLLAAYVAAELGVAAWMVEFLQQERGKSVTVSSIFLSSYFVFMMAGRLMGAFFIESFGYLRAIAVALVGSSVCLFFGIQGSGAALFLLPLSGLFMSIVFPTVAAAVTDLHKANVGTILGILFAFAGLGGALGPWTIGCLSDVFGLETGLTSAVLFLITGLAAWGNLRRP